MTLSEILHALADGKAVQTRSLDGRWYDRTLREALELVAHEPCAVLERMRLKPVPVPPGDLTWEEACELERRGLVHEVQWLDTIDAGASGTWRTGRAGPHVPHRRTPTPNIVLVAPTPDVERKCLECGHPVGNHHAKGCVAWLDEDDRYCSCRRTADSFKPAPKMVPLDIKPGMWLRSPSGADWLVVNCTDNHVSLVYVLGSTVHGHGLTPTELQELGWMITNDAGATWQRCERLAKEGE